MKLIAVDCGWGGAVAYWISDRDRLGLRDCPGDALGIIKFLRRLKKRYGDDWWTAILEANSPSPLFGARGNFGLGLNIGTWEASLVGENIPFTNINPKTWQKLVSNQKSRQKKGRKAVKEKAWRYARFNFPKYAEELGDDVPNPRNPKQGRADALCILDYGRKEML